MLLKVSARAFRQALIWAATLERRSDSERAHRAPQRPAPADLVSSDIKILLSDPSKTNPNRMQDRFGENFVTWSHPAVVGRHPGKGFLPIDIWPDKMTGMRAWKALAQTQKSDGDQLTRADPA